jgi:hypothetical protein
MNKLCVEKIKKIKKWCDGEHPTHANRSPKTHTQNPNGLRYA